MNESLRAQVRWSAVAGLCFLLSMVISETVLPSLVAFPAHSNTAVYFHITLGGIVFLAFAATFIWHLKGYLVLATMESIGWYTFFIRAFMLAIVLFALGKWMSFDQNLFSLSETTRDLLRIYNGGTFLFFILAATVCSLGAFRFKHIDASAPLTGLSIF